MTLAKKAEMASSPNSPLVETYLQKRPDLIRLFTARTGSKSEAEEIVQEIYLKIVAGTNVQIDDMIGYIYKIGYNLMLDRIRSRRRAVAREGDYYRVRRAGYPDEDSSNDPSPETQAFDRLTLARLIAIIDGFPPHCRRVFIMHKIDGLSYAEIAAKLRVSVSAVEKQMMSALKRLALARDHLGRE